MADIGSSARLYGLRDGEFVPWQDATAHVLAQSLQRGALAFDYLSVHAAKRGIAMFRVRDHVQRLLRTCRLVGLPLRYAADQLVDARAETVRRNPGAKSVKSSALIPSVEVDDGTPARQVLRGGTWRRAGVRALAALRLAGGVARRSVFAYSIAESHETKERPVAVELPEWLEALRRVEVVARVRSDPRSASDGLLGVGREGALAAIEGGQASFDEPWGVLSPADRVLLYAFFNQKGHLEELTEAFRMIFANTTPEDPIVVDLGCGPATGGLALAGALDTAVFDYIGVDSSKAMREFGEHLAGRASRLDGVRRRWASTLESVEWDRAPGWRPVLVIVSYLLGSPSLNPVQMVDRLNDLLAKLGRGRVIMLYTNSSRVAANRKLPAFQQALQRAGFDMPAHGTDEIMIERREGDRPRQLRYAVFHRPAASRLHLGGG